MTPDIVPKLLVELRDDAGVAAIVGVNPTADPPRVRGARPAPKTDTYDGDAQGPGSYRAFVVLVQLDAPTVGRAPVQRPLVAARCYGRTDAEAASLRWAVSAAIHYVGPRVHTNGLGIYLSKDSAGGEQEEDPLTRQPYQTIVIESLATTQAVA